MYSQPQPIPPNIHPLLTVGVVADTHIPDRVGTLHPELIPTLKAAGVGHILHAGDICVPGVLDELSQVAPVTAARGNRDILLSSLPLVQNITLEGVEIALMHGHGGLWFYLWDKWQFVFLATNSSVTCGCCAIPVERREWWSLGTRTARKTAGLTASCCSTPALPG
jgi:hypothetical protein